MAVTIKDVALRARVSIASVSRALHGTGVVTEKTRLRVERAAQQLRYTPHGVARSLITRRTNTIGVLLPDIYGEYFSELIRGIDRAARLRGLHLLVSSSHGDAEEASLALRAMSGRVDGVLIMSPYVDANLLDQALPATLPTVLMNTPADAEWAPAFLTDNFGGARAMVEHLRALGHQRIAHITGPESNFESGERLRGFRAALGRTLVAQSLVVPGNFTEESGYLAGRQIAAATPRPDAVFAGNDMMAIGCLFALTEAGVRVPQDIALAGFDDIPIARFVTPPLTTVRAQTTELGRQALEELVRAVEQPDSVRRARHTLSTTLVIRASCASRQVSTAAVKTERN
ncbi:MAG TPA: LacI family DNA-binding transcriptional regulator [Steroidobacteraceae bacterium]|nr:LacI family DNA-binding transcriptional regulator [Steroidobacteraceae bacterium]